ncbi:MAG TPA: hypothetical protein VK964_13995 [Nocardioidaceae bacterium]|nr:hypothetical protein [Nocardioidaceae bacterium]
MRSRSPRRHCLPARPRARATRPTTPVSRPSTRRPADVEGRWLDWKTQAATTSDGELIGYGTDIGPEAICYRADLFEKAGLRTDRAEVAELFTTWDDYFAAGRQFVAEVPDTAWYDASGGTAQAMINQVEYAYEDQDNNVVAADNSEVKAVFDAVTSNKELGTGLTQWSEDWTKAFQNDGFATMACLPGLEARCHRGERRRCLRLGHRRCLPRRRRQLGWLLPDHADAVQAPRGGQGARRMADRTRAADQGVHVQGHVPQPGRRSGGPRPHRHDQRVLQRRTDG